MSDDYQDGYYFLSAVGRKAGFVAERLLALLIAVLPLPRRLLLVIDDEWVRRRPNFSILTGAAFAFALGLANYHQQFRPVESSSPCSS